MKHLLSLIVVAEGHVRSQLDPSFRGFEFTQKHSEQRGLSHAVGAEDADLFTTLDIEVHVREKMSVGKSVIERLSQIFRHHHVVSGLEVLFETELHSGVILFRFFQPVYHGQSFYS